MINAHFNILIIHTIPSDLISFKFKFAPEALCASIQVSRLSSVD